MKTIEELMQDLTVKGRSNLIWFLEKTIYEQDKEDEEFGTSVDYVLFLVEFVERLKKSGTLRIGYSYAPDNEKGKV